MERIDFVSQRHNRNAQEYFTSVGAKWKDLEKPGIVSLAKTMIEEEGVDPEMEVEVYATTGTLSFTSTKIKYWAYGYPKKEKTNV